ncbi:MAG TPA: sigma-70 family RNA polymerase sigma factor [Candidatus Eisenbergiella intestinipullorum]|nr:sigma-70 family RNA polymerase sigma factor [Candidatus Eisenbergiella intestinipullorum]
MTDWELLELLEADPGLGILALIEQYTDLLSYVVSLRLRNPLDIQECVQDTFTDFYLSRKNFNPEKGTLSAYLVAIARHKAIYRFREIQKEKELTLAAKPPEDPVGMEEHAALEHTLSQLADTDAKVLRMKYYEGYTAREIGEILGLSHEAVKKRIQRALKKAMSLMAE